MADDHESPLFPAKPAKAQLPDDVPVQYIGRRPQYRDRLYRTNLTFTTHQVRVLPRAIAERFLRHKDLFAIQVEEPEKAEDTGDQVPNVPDEPSDPESTESQLERAAEEKQAQDRTENELQDLKDRVQQMDKGSLEEFARINYRQELDRRRSVGKLREEVVSLIDQYGAV